MKSKINRVNLAGILVIAVLAIGFSGIFTEASNINGLTDISVKTKDICAVDGSDADKNISEEECKSEFEEIPDIYLCPSTKTLILDSCSVGTEACISNDSAKGKWCSCKYRCI